MERDLQNLDDQIKALELKKHEEKERYEEKLRVLQRVTLHTYLQWELTLLGAWEWERERSIDPHHMGFSSLLVLNC